MDSTGSHGSTYPHKARDGHSKSTAPSAHSHKSHDVSPPPTGAHAAVVDKAVPSEPPKDKGSLDRVPIVPLAILLGATLAPLLLGCGVLGWRSENGFKALLVIFFLSLNSGLSLLNRWALGLFGLRFPLVMTAMHMIFGSFALSPLMLLSERYSSQHEAILQKDWKGIALVGAMNGVQIAMNNASLTMIELSMNQVIRAFGPVFTAILAICIEGRFPSKSEWPTLFCISVGVALTAGKDLSPSAGASFIGICLTVASIVMQSSIISMSSKMMSGSIKLNGLQMTFYSGPFAFVTLLPFALTREYDAFVESLNKKPTASVGFLLGSCVLAVCYNITVFQSSHSLSSVGTAVLANAKIIILIVLSAIILGELSGWSVQEFVGCSLALAGTAYFSYLKIKPKLSVAPSESDRTPCMRKERKDGN